MNRKFITYEQALEIKKITMEEEVNESMVSIKTTFMTEDFLSVAEKSFYCSMVYDDLIENYVEDEGVVDDNVTYIVNYLIGFYVETENFERCGELYGIIN